MLEEINAVYRDGVFVPDEPCDLADNTRVRLTLGSDRNAGTVSAELAYPPHVIPPSVTDPEERKRLWQELFRMMSENPMPVDAPKLTREEMHERR